jgi:crossover junction endodeoxyribonuclease RuvC
MIDSASLVLAADPGMSGALALLGQGQLRILRDFKKPEDIVQAVKEFSTAEPELMVIEDVHAMPGQGVVSMFTFGHATGVMRGALLALFPGVPLIKVG